jgi:type II secretory pathway component GspD/PulD (secretin)
MAHGKLQADLGRTSEAAAAFDAVAQDPRASDAQRWEALVRLGVARRETGDGAGSVAAFQKVMADFADDPEAIRFLVLSVGGALPGRERWDAIWRDVRLEVEGARSGRPQAVVVWPGVARAQPPTTGRTMDVDFEDANLGDLYRFFADFTGLNVVVQPGTLGRVTIHARKEPWERVLERVLAPSGLAYRLEGNLLWIAEAEVVSGWPARAFSGALVDVRFQDEDLREAFAWLARQGGLELALSPEVAGHVTLRLDRVPWDQALDVVLRVNDLEERRQGSRVSIAPRASTPRS